jgi:lysyl-tRNA synthetase class 2
MEHRMIARAEALRAVRGYFAADGVLEVDTPAMVPSPGLDLHLDAFELSGDGDASHRFLITSPEYQMKRLLTEGLSAIYQISRCFRRGERGRWHHPEFVMIEWYRCGVGYREMMADTERLVRCVADALGGGLSIDGRALSLDGAFEKLTVSHAFETLAGVAEAKMLEWANHDEDSFFSIWVDQVEPALATRRRPVFVYDYPAPQASLARCKPGDPRFCERFELYAGGVELCNGFGELTDAREQGARFERDVEQRRSAGKPQYPIDERFLQALATGLAPCAGNALGFDRLLALCLGADSIADVMAFGNHL